MPNAPHSAVHLKVTIIDPWVVSPQGMGIDRTQRWMDTLAVASHEVTLLAGRSRTAPTAARERQRIKTGLSPLSARFGYPATAATGFGYRWRLWMALLFSDSPDVVVMRYPPQAGAFTLSLMSLVSGAALVVDATGTPGELTARNSVQRACDSLRLKVLRRMARLVITASPDIKAWFETKGFAPSRIIVAPDGSDTDLFSGADTSSPTILDRYPNLMRGMVCIYAGALHRGRRIAEWLEIAAATLPIAPDIHFAIIGDGPDRLDLNAYAARLDVLEKNVWFVPAMARADLAKAISRAHIVAAIPPKPHLGGLDAGSHVFDGLAAGKPIAVLGDGWQRELIEPRQAGVVLPADNPDAAARELADVMREPELLKRAGEQALALATGKNNISRIATDVRHAIERVAAEHSRSAVWRERNLAMKRTCDVVIALFGLVVLSPILLLISLVLLAAGWAPIAARLRSGHKGKPFRLFTFDTLKAEGDGRSGWRQRFAHVLRRTALDRLPELVNVLMGDMSLVGPRPLPAEYAAYYTEAQSRRFELRPGITGWAQVNGRQGLSWDEMFTYDAWYVDHYSFGLDLKILARTLWGLVIGRSQSGVPVGQLPRFDEIEARRQGAEDV